MSYRNQYMCSGEATSYHNCIKGPFSLVPWSEGPKTGICPLCTGPYKKSKDYTTMIMENPCIIVAIMPLY